MPIKKTGTPTGRYDIRHNDVCIGDYIKTINSAYFINKYEMPQNPICGSRMWAGIGDVELINEEEYTDIINSQRFRAMTPEPQPELELIDLEEEPQEKKEEPDEIQQAVAEAEVAGTPSEVSDLSSFSDDKLRNELVARGYRGKLTHTYTITVTDTLEL